MISVLPTLLTFYFNAFLISTGNIFFKKNKRLFTFNKEIGEVGNTALYKVHVTTVN